MNYTFKITSFPGTRYPGTIQLIYPKTLVLFIGVVEEDLSRLIAEDINSVITFIFIYYYINMHKATW